MQKKLVLFATDCQCCTDTRHACRVSVCPTRVSENFPDTAVTFNIVINMGENSAAEVGLWPFDA